MDTLLYPPKKRKRPAIYVRPSNAPKIYRPSHCVFPWCPYPAVAHYHSVSACTHHEKWLELQATRDTDLQQRKALVGVSKVRMDDWAEYYSGE